jgi:uncharacterized membrane protein YeiH
MLGGDSAFGMGAGAALILGVITAVGGGTMRDVRVAQAPVVLHTGLYAVPALVAAVITVAAVTARVYGRALACIATGACFLIRMLGVQFKLERPMPPSGRA